MDVRRELAKAAQRVEKATEALRKEEQQRDQLIRYAVASKEMSQAEVGRVIGRERSRVNAIIKGT
jgi:predicted XRE-type DNA-binding protein